MADGVGLSVGATNLAAVMVNRAAVTRTPVLTLYPHRPPEVGVPSENPNLNERGLIITDFVDRVGDPVAIVASDGSTHRGEALLADALRALLYAATRGQPPADPVGVTHPAHWRPTSVDALCNALTAMQEFQEVTVVSDATASLTALQNDPGVPARGVIALCDFGGTGTTITLVDAGNGYQPIGPTVRHTDLSGDLIDQALLTHVINDLSAAGTVDLSSTSAIGSLSRLRGQCRGAKERLSTSAVTTLVAELPGHRSDVRLTRDELHEAIRQPVTEFIGVVQETVDRSGILPDDLVAVASAGGGARIPFLTTALSEHFRVPVITTAQPELTAAVGGGLRAARGAVEEGMTAMAAAPVAAAAAVAVEPDDMAQSSTFRALAWSDADDVPDVAPTDPYDYAGEAATGTAARPQLRFGEPEPYEQEPAALPWYRRPQLVFAVAVAAVLAALVLAWLFVLRDDSTPSPASTTTAPTTTTVPPAPAPPPAERPAPQQEPAQQAPAPRTVYQAPPPVTRTQAPPPPPPPPTSEAPPPTSEPPPPPPTSEPPPSPPTSEPPAWPAPPPWTPTAPYPTIPGLPWVPAPGGGGGTG